MSLWRRQFRAGEPSVGWRFISAKVHLTRKVNAMTVKYKKLPPLDVLEEMFNFNSNSGELLWKMRPPHHFDTKASQNRWNARHAGKVAGCKNNSTGYVNVSINNSPYLAHRIIWAVNGFDLPEDMEIDHKNGNKKDNRIDNLRIVTSSQNSFNSRAKSTNKSGVKGVHWHESSGTWRAVITVKGRQVYAKHFKSLAEASKSISIARQQLHGEYVNSAVW